MKLTSYLLVVITPVLFISCKQHKKVVVGKKVMAEKKGENKISLNDTLLIVDTIGQGTALAVSTAYSFKDSKNILQYSDYFFRYINETLELDPSIPRQDTIGGKIKKYMMIVPVSKGNTALFFYKKDSDHPNPKPVVYKVLVY